MHFLVLDMHFDPILSCPSDFSDSVSNHTKLPLRVKTKNSELYWCGETFTQREKNREFKVANVHDPHVLQDQNYP